MLYFVGVAGEVICFADGRFCPPFTNNKFICTKHTGVKAIQLLVAT